MYLYNLDNLSNISHLSCLFFLSYLFHLSYLYFLSHLSFLFYIYLIYHIYPTYLTSVVYVVFLIYFIYIYITYLSYLFCLSCLCVYLSFCLSIYLSIYLSKFISPFILMIPNPTSPYCTEIVLNNTQPGFEACVVSSLLGVPIFSQTCRYCRLQRPKASDSMQVLWPFGAMANSLVSSKTTRPLVDRDWPPKRMGCPKLGVISPDKYYPLAN
jgi:hypothetical protein